MHTKWSVNEKEKETTRLTWKCIEDIIKMVITETAPRMWAGVIVVK